jgi:hypothetical protein
MDASNQEAALRDYTDLLRLSLAANLRDYPLVTYKGELKKGSSLKYNGPVMAGYTRRPCENINYAACHDNETLFDQVRLFICGLFLKLHLEHQVNGVMTGRPSLIRTCF